MLILLQPWIFLSFCLSEKSIFLWSICYVLQTNRFQKALRLPLKNFFFCNSLIWLFISLFICIYTQQISIWQAEIRLVVLVKKMIDANFRNTSTMTEFMKKIYIYSVGHCTCLTEFIRTVVPKKYMRYQRQKCTSIRDLGGNDRGHRYLLFFAIFLLFWVCCFAMQLQQQRSLSVWISILPLPPPLGLFTPPNGLVPPVLRDVKQTFALNPPPKHLLFFSSFFFPPTNSNSFFGLNRDQAKPTNAKVFAQQ